MRTTAFALNFLVSELYLHLLVFYILLLAPPPRSGPVPISPNKPTVPPTQKIIVRDAEGRHIQVSPGELHKLVSTGQVNPIPSAGPQKLPPSQGHPVQLDQRNPQTAQRVSRSFAQTVRTQTYLVSFRVCSRGDLLPPPKGNHSLLLRGRSYRSPTNSPFLLLNKVHV